jgi:hypothetical protein
MPSPVSAAPARRSAPSRRRPLSRLPRRSPSCARMNAWSAMRTMTSPAGRRSSPSVEADGELVGAEAMPSASARRPSHWVSWPSLAPRLTRCLTVCRRRTRAGPRWRCRPLRRRLRVQAARQGESDQRHPCLESAEQERDPQPTRGRDPRNSERCRHRDGVKAERDNQRDKVCVRQMSVGEPGAAPPGVSHAVYAVGRAPPSARNAGLRRTLGECSPCSKGRWGATCRAWIPGCVSPGRRMAAPGVGRRMGGRVR